MDQETVKKLSDASFASSIEKGKTLVDFYAEWCGPCRMIAPVLEEIAKEMAGSVTIGKVDIDTEQKTAADFQVSSVPTLILFKDGKEAGRLVGLRDKEAIKEFIQSA